MGLAIEGRSFYGRRWRTTEPSKRKTFTRSTALVDPQRDLAFRLRPIGAYNVMALTILAAALLAACGAPAPAPPAAIEKTTSDGAVDLTLRVDRNRVSVAENVRVRVEAAFPESWQVDFPDTLGEEAEFRSAVSDTSPPRLGEDGKVRIEQTYVIEPYMPGKLTIPAIEIRYQGKGAIEDDRSISTEAFEVEVEPIASAEEKAAELRDIHDPLELPLPLGWIIGGSLVALAAAVGAWMWWKSRQVPAPELDLPPESPDAIAMRALDSLLAQRLAEKGLIKELYGGVSDILRRYIEARFGLHAPEQTTEEFLTELRRTLGFDPAHRALLRQFMEHTDLVKFAEARPTANQIDATVAACRSFIVETKPKPAPEVVEGPLVPRA